jgi:AraC-like DNA-binding protein
MRAIENLKKNPAQHPDSDPRFAAALFHPRLLRFLCTLARSRGANPERLCAGLGFAVDDLDDASLRVSPRQVSTFLRRALPLFPDRSWLMMKVGARPSGGAFGLLGLAMMSAPTLGDALRLGVQYRRAAGMMTEFALTYDDKEFFLEIDDLCRDSEVGPFLVEATCAFLIHHFALLQGKRFVPLRVELAYPRPAAGAHYDPLFMCPVKFGAAQSGIVGALEWLKTPLPGSDPLTHQQAVETLRRTAPAREGGEDDLVQAIDHLLRKNLSHPPSIAEVAKSMNMSERTLRRRLRKTQASFRELLARARANVALEMMRIEHKTNEQVAAKIGFSDPRNFRRAFKRWTGALPSALKKAGDGNAG